MWNSFMSWAYNVCIIIMIYVSFERYISWQLIMSAKYKCIIMHEGKTRLLILG